MTITINLAILYQGDLKTLPLKKLYVYCFTKANAFKG